MIKYFCSDGERVSQATIDRRRSEAYQKKYGPYPQICKGCGKRAGGSAHTIPQARCKTLHHTEWIWSDFNFWPACHTCNSLAEGSGYKILLNRKELEEVWAAHDPQLLEIRCNILR